MVYWERTVELASGISLFVAATEERGDRAVLVVHGGPDWDHSYLREPLDQLAGEWQVVLSDLRGCGRSSKGLGDEQYTPDAVVGDLLQLADELGLNKFAVLGFSYGGMIAQRLAVAAPDRVSHLVIASSSVLSFDDTMFDVSLDRETALAAEAAVWADPSSPGPELARAAAIASAPADVWTVEPRPGYRERLATMRFSGEWLRPWRAGTLPSARLDDPVAALATTDVPILLLHGRQDMRFPASAAEQAAELLPRARAVVIDQAGHMAHIDQPDKWLDAITDFLT